MKLVPAEVARRTAVRLRRAAPWLAAGLVAAAALGKSSIAAQDTLADAAVRTPADTYESLELAELVEEAREARRRAARGLEGYSAAIRHRIYVGLTAKGLRRERGLFEQERVGRVRWASDGSELIEWQRMRASVPVAGFDTRRADPDSTSWREGRPSITVRASTEMADDLSDELLREDEIPAFSLDPFADNLALDSGDFVHPLADEAPLHYRYHAGDTLEIDLPGDLRDIVLYEVRVEPRETDYRLLSASLWIDSESKALARAGYRPARPFNLALDSPEEDDLEGMPRWLARRVEAEVHYIAIEYSLHQMEYWLPRRLAFEGEGRFVGWVEWPITLEWSLSRYSVNDGVSAAAPEDPPPEGWRVSTDTLASSSGDSIERAEPDPTRTVVVAPLSELLHHPELSRAPVGSAPLEAFTEFEISSLTRGLERRVARRYVPRLLRGFDDILRYNRVEGLSLGLGAEMPLGPRWSATGSARAGTGEWVPYASLGLQRHGDRGMMSFEAFRELRSMSDDAGSFSLFASLDALFFADDPRQYYRARGFNLGYERDGAAGWSLSAFAERHEAVELNSDFSFRSLFDDYDFPPVLEAEPAELYGVRASLSWFHGLDPSELIVTGRMDGEAALGDLSYSRVQAALSASHPLPFRLAGALEVSAGRSWGELPVQRSFFLGGESFRGSLVDEFRGESYWRTRAEIATGMAAARIAVFTDLGSIGSSLSFSDPLATVGIGFSLLDGLFRLDLARGVSIIERWRLHLYVDGLL